MPHVIVKLYPGRSHEAQKRLADRIARAVVEEAGCKERSVSVAFEEVAPEDWAETVYRKEILNSPGTLVREPGYNPFKPAAQAPEEDKSLMAYVREAAETAASLDTSGMFNPMSWMDTELEERPDSFDPFFARPWHHLSETEQQDRMKAIRAVL